MKEAILQHLPGDFPWQVHWYPSLGSTNDLAKSMAKDGAPHGTVILAAHQTKGRGRMGRSFQSPAGKGIYLSLILRPACSVEQLMHLTCAAGTAMCDAVEAVCGCRPGTKWINDLVISGKKLGGILTEMSLTTHGRIEYCILGIGLNCQKAPLSPEVASIATSLEAATGRSIAPAPMAAAMISALYRLDGRLLTQRAAIMAAYRKDCITVGKEVMLLRPDGQQAATALDVDDDGALVVRYPDGTQGRVQSGEASVRTPQGYC